MEKLAILLFDQAQPMDIIGPWEVLSTWKNSLKAPITLSLVAETKDEIACVNDIHLKPHVDFDHCPPLDYLIVPGGIGRLQAVQNETLINFIRQQATSCKILLSDCTGAFLLLKAGLLAGKNCTTYWRALPELHNQLDLHIVEERVVKDDKIWTAGGISSGIDLALALIEEIAGKEVAGQVQLLFEYFPSRKIYCSEKTAQSLPPYYGSAPTATTLPTYIREMIEHNSSIESHDDEAKKH